MTLSFPVTAASRATTSAPKDAPRSRRASRATRRCKCSSRPTGARTRALCPLSWQRPLTPPLSYRSYPLPLARSLCNNGIGDGGVTALAAILHETKITDLTCAASPGAHLSVNIDTTSATALFPACSQSCREQYRSQKRSCSRGGPEGQLDAAVAGVGLLALEPAPCSPFCQRPLTRLLSRRSHRSQSRIQQHGRQGRLRARCRPQGDEDDRPQVRRHPQVLGRVGRACSSAHLTPLRPARRSLEGNDLSDKTKKAVKKAAGSGVSIEI